MQADDFLKAHKLLTKSLSATQFGGICPSVVCLAFSIEVYIKDLFDVLGEKQQRGHDILKLFKKLPVEIQQEIFSHGEIGSQVPWVVFESPFAPKSGKNEDGISDLFIYELEAISDAFTKWRYSHEDENVNLRYNTGFALAFVTAVKSITDKKRSQAQTPH